MRKYYLISCSLSQSELFHWQKVFQTSKKQVYKSQRMDVIVITVNKSGRKASSTNA